MFEPWCIQECISGIFSLKMAYDIKACNLGLPQIPLAKAVVAFAFIRWLGLTKKKKKDFFFFFFLKKTKNLIE